MKFKSLFLLIGTILLSSCNMQREIVYFQDSKNGTNEVIAVQDGRIRLQPDDVISIIVKSRDPNLTNLFNLPYYTQRIGTTHDSYNGLPNGVTTYLVNEDGDITFPVVGKIHVAGLTRSQLAELLQNRLTSENLVKDPVVSIDFANLYVSVLGDVNKPGRIRIDHDAFTILDAISAAGDLNITGRRAQLKVLRKEEGTQHTYIVDLRSSGDIVNSPVYYLKQNDVVYVEPNKMKARQSTVNGNNVLNTSFWISLTSLAVTILLAIKNFNN